MRHASSRRRSLPALLLVLFVGVGACAMLASEGAPAAARDSDGLSDGAGPLSCVQRVGIPALDQVMESHWSPDASHLAFTHILTSPADTTSGFQEDPALSVLDLATRAVTDIGPGQRPHWSATGTYLSYWHAGRLRIIKAGRLLTILDPTMPETRWVGDQLVYWDGDEIRGWTEDGEAAISTVSPDYVPVFPRDWADFSADGALFSLTRYSMDGTADRWVGEVKTGRLTPLDSPGTTYTQWSPTGETLLVRSDERVELRGPNGADSVAPVSSFPGPVHGWTPDGAELLMGKVSPTVPASVTFDHFAIWDGHAVTGTATLPNLLGSRAFSRDGRYFAGVVRDGLDGSQLEVYRCGGPPVRAASRADPLARERQARIADDPRRFVRPVSGFFSQFLTATHTGIDVAAPFGSIITAADDGVVDWVGWRPVGGRAVCVEHAGGLESCDYHISLALVHVGQRVARGEPVALVGMTGETLGPHTHWEAKLNGEIVDPLKQ